MNKLIGEKISEYRRACALTREQLREKLGITGQALSKRNFMSESVKAPADKN